MRSGRARQSQLVSAVSNDRATVIALNLLYKETETKEVSATLGRVAGSPAMPTDWPRTFGHGSSNGVGTSIRINSRRRPSGRPVMGSSPI